MVGRSQVAQSKAIQRRTGRTFHLATRLLPKRIREPTYVLYAFFRVADEVVDDVESDTDPAAQRERLEQSRAAALGDAETDDPVLAAFSKVRERTGMDEADVETFIDAMLADIDRTRYETYEDLEAYMDGSAAAVGRMMTAVMDPVEKEQALPHATALGEAFQMTNFIRDVREDVEDRGRVYLPISTLSEHGATEKQIRRLEFDDAVGAAVRHELERTERLYETGVAGIEYLPADCQFAVLLAAVLYADHHREIRKLEYDVVNHVPELGRARKLWLLVRTRIAWSLTGKDPERTFDRVSAIERGERAEANHETERHTGRSRFDWLPTR